MEACGSLYSQNVSDRDSTLFYLILTGFEPQLKLLSFRTHVYKGQGRFGGGGDL
jgi:hypothetical protein